MRSYLNKQQLTNPNFSIVEATTRSCVHCGLCTATCPTFKLTGNELDSPRGRIYLLKDMLENERPASAIEVRHIDRCLTCLSCLSTCPVNVDYRHLLDVGRQHIAKTYQRPILQRLYRTLVQKILTVPQIFHFVIMIASWIKPISKVLPSKLEIVFKKIPKKVKAHDKYSKPNIFKSKVTRKRVALMPGCVQQTLGVDINASTVRVLNRLGCDVIIPPSTTCCGAIEYHLDNVQSAKVKAIKNIQILKTLLDNSEIDSIIFNSSGCGMHVKDYPFQFSENDTLKQDAELVASNSMDVTEVIAELGFDTVKDIGQSEIPLTYHASCSLQHAQGITDSPLVLLKQGGFKVNIVPEGHLCCGGAGTYSLFQTEISEQLGELKAQNISSTKPHIVAAGNIACINQLETKLDVPVVHTVQLLDWVTGGPSPLE